MAQLLAFPQTSFCRRSNYCSVIAMIARRPATQQLKYKGSLVVNRKSFLDLTDVGAHLLDAAADILGKDVFVQLISSHTAPGAPKLSNRTSAEGWLLSGGILAEDEASLELDFDVDEDFGIPGAFIIQNQHPNEFYLRSFNLQLPGYPAVEFACNSWVYNFSRYKYDRIFFSNHLHLPNDTPAGLVEARAQELLNIRGDGTGTRQVWERIYDYDVYNDIGNPDSDESMRRPVLGGSAEFPYPRRCRTGREPTKSDPSSESLPEGGANFYVPSDERFSTSKNSNFLTGTLKAASQSVAPFLEMIFTKDQTFDSFQEVNRLYSDGIQSAECPPGALEVFNTLTSGSTGSLVQYPTPAVIEKNETAWMSDDEFARQMLSGLNPMGIQLLKEFPPKSSLDPAKYGKQISAITDQHISKQLEGETVQEALQNKKLFILDYHDAYMPYLDRINSQEGIYAYASRTVLYLRADGTLKPVAIELSTPRQQRVFVPPADGKIDWLWQLAKTHVTTNDSGYHQLISHFLRTHACIEPFAIATHRNLSALHPLNRFLMPHFRNTMTINSRARQALINAGGIIETNFSTGKYSLELSSVVYKSWRFDEQGLPADLLKRGMATKDPNSKHGFKLTIEDYPYAADGLEIWALIEKWTSDYIDSCYQNDEEIASDSELQAWWTEIVTVGHGDKKDEPWWVKLDGKTNLVNVLTTLIWLASAHHAAVNFGQYAYAGYMPNHPTATHRAVPEEGSEEHKKLIENPEKFFLSAVSRKSEATIVMTTIELLSTHASDEEYLGQREVKEWTNNPKAESAFARFSAGLREVEELIKARNADPKLKNRVGPAQVPYTLLIPSSEPGLTGRGIPNSVSI